MLYRIFDDMTQCSEQTVARLLPLVSAQRREQALGYKHTFGQYCCLQSYKMLCELLAEWSRVHQLPINQQPIFLYNDYGAPYIEGGPHFSISHCKRGIAVAVSENPIGIDIEAIRTFSPDLMRKTMNEDEQQRITSSATPDQEFIRLWTQKEALLKLQGTGIISDLHHVLDHTQDLSWTEISHLSPDYICTICSMNK
jgi:4'-phosphopantetheinyl transferase